MTNDITKTVRIRPHLHIKCKAAADDRNIRMQDWLEEVLENHFKKLQKGNIYDR